VCWEKTAEVNIRRTATTKLERHIMHLQPDCRLICALHYLDEGTQITVAPTRVKRRNDSVKKCGRRVSCVPP